MKKTRRSLFTSLVTLLLCSAMFVGSTFAWFTDTVSNTGNKIQAGTLDIGLEQYKKVSSEATPAWIDIEGDNKPAFNSGEGIALWEPGYSQYGVFRITNKESNLAFKYKLKAELKSETIGKDGQSISDVIDVYTILLPGKDTAENVYTNATTFDKFMEIYSAAAAESKATTSLKAMMSDEDGAAHGILIPTGLDYTNACLSDEQKATIQEEEAYAIVVLHMQESAGNEYQGLDATFDIKVEAAQVTIEKDGFGACTYDAKANGDPDHPEFDIASAPVVEKKDILPIMKKTEDSGQTKVNIETIIETEGLKVTYPVGVLTNDLSQKDTDQQDYTGAKQGFEYVSDQPSTKMEEKGVEIRTDQSVLQFELTLEAVHDNNTVLVEAERKNIGTGLTGVKVYHNGEELSKVESSTSEYFRYDPVTGELRVFVFHASPIDVVYDKVAKYVAQVESTKYTDALTAFIDAEKINQSVLILDNCEVELDKLPDDVDFDLNGKVLTKINIATDPVSSLEGSDIYVDVWNSWGMEGMKDANGNECPQYLLVTDTVKYRDLGVKEGSEGDWISGKEIAEYFASRSDYTYIYHMYINKTPVSVFDGNTTALKYFENGNGSQTKPYIIKNQKQFRNIAKLSDYLLVDSENYEVIKEKKNNKTYFIKIDKESLDFSNISGAIWQLTAASPGINASGFNVVIDFNNCEISGKDLTFGSVGKYMAEPLYDPNFGISYAVGYFLGSVYDRPYNVTIRNAKFNNCGVSAENGISLTLENCSFDYSSYNQAIRSYQQATSTAGAVSHVIKNCTFNNCYANLGGGSGNSYEINTQLINCEFTKETTGGYNSIVKYDSYTYGNLLFDGCEMTVNLGKNYNPIKIETNQNYIGEHSVDLTIKDTTINWTSAIGAYDDGTRVPVSRGIATIKEQGTNSYIVNGTAVKYDGAPLDE